MAIREHQKMTFHMKALSKKASTFLGPLTYSIAGGHFRSALLSRPVDAFGKPLPWYTYPAVDFLSLLDFSETRIAEFGSGQSTLWWADRAKEVLALEYNPDWFEEIGEKTAGLSNVELKRVTSPQDAGQQVKEDYFDVIVVDDSSGQYPAGRQVNAETAFARVKRNGLVIVDNSNANYGKPGHYPVIEHAREAGWLRIDFIGQAPGSTRRHSTTLFFRPEVTLLSSIRSPSFSSIIRRAA